MDNLVEFEAILFDVGNTLVEQRFYDSDKSRASLLPGVAELLRALTGKFRLGVVSNSKVFNSTDIKNKLEECGIADYFEVFVSSLDVGEEKPSPLPLKVALEKMNISCEKALYIGDNEIDRLAAQSAGMEFLFTSKDIRESFSDYEISIKSAWQRGLGKKIRNFPEVAVEIRSHIDGRAKPKDSLGRLEEMAIQISNITGEAPKIDPAGAAIFVADHGVAADNSVTPWPQSITARMADLIVDGNAAVSVLARNSDVYLEVINLGTVSKTHSINVRNETISTGTLDFRQKEAMSESQLNQALEVGAKTAERLIAGGSRSISIGEVGIGNTTSSAILIGMFCGVTAVEVTGRGSGIPDEVFNSKLLVVADQIGKLSSREDPLKILRNFGGFELAAMVGLIVRSASLNIPVILDGVTTLASALVAVAIKPEVRDSMLLGHLSSEPASKIAAENLNLKPILDLDLRLGEGTGAILSVPIIRAACRLHAEMSPLSDVVNLDSSS